MKTVALVALAVVALVPLPVMADDDALARFKGGIGVHPVSNVSGTANTDGSFPNVTRNVVRGVNPAGQLWVISDLRATVKVDGRIKVDGRGLLLAGGNGIGTNAGASVFATLLCQDGVVNTIVTFTSHSTNSNPGVPLAANGDFRIEDMLSPTPPNPCNNPVLLIRNTSTNAGQGWFAAGIPKLEDHD